MRCLLFACFSFFFCSLPFSQLTPYGISIREEGPQSRRQKGRTLVLWQLLILKKEDNRNEAAKSSFWCHTTFYWNQSVEEYGIEFLLPLLVVVLSSFSSRLPDVRERIIGSCLLHIEEVIPRFFLSLGWSSHGDEIKNIQCSLFRCWQVES